LYQEILGSGAGFIFQTCSLTTELTQIEQLGTTDFTAFLNLKLGDKWRVIRENTLYAYVIGDFTDGKRLVGTRASNVDNNALILLNTLFFSSRTR